jgi:hypothetical protein
MKEGRYFGQDQHFLEKAASVSSSPSAALINLVRRRLRAAFEPASHGGGLGRFHFLSRPLLQTFQLLISPLAEYEKLRAARSGARKMAKLPDLFSPNAKKEERGTEMSQICFRSQGLPANINRAESICKHSHIKQYYCILINSLTT